MVRETFPTQNRGMSSCQHRETSFFLSHLVLILHLFLPLPPFLPSFTLLGQLLPRVRMLLSILLEHFTNLKRAISPRSSWTARRPGSRSMARRNALFDTPWYGLTGVGQEVGKLPEIPVSWSREQRQKRCTVMMINHLVRKRDSASAFMTQSLGSLAEPWCDGGGVKV